MNLWKPWLIWKKDDEEDYHSYWENQKVPDEADKRTYEGDEEEPESSYDLDDYEEEEGREDKKASHIDKKQKWKSWLKSRI